MLEAFIHNGMQLILNTPIHAYVQMQNVERQKENVLNGNLV